MKKIILTSVLALCMACPSYATTLTGSGNECNEPILNTDTGPAELRAIWGANTINLEWYSDDTLLDVQSSADTCLYDGAIILPTTNPTKTGYTFGGWQVREAVAQLFNLATLSSYIDTNGSAYAYIRFDGTRSTPYENGSRKPDRYNLSTPGEWATEFSYGTVRGIARCSTQHPTTFWYNNNNTFTSDHFAQSLTDETGQSDARYCWCQPTGFAEPNSSSYMSVASPSWVFDGDVGSAGACASACATRCPNRVKRWPDFRRAMYGISQ